MNIEEIVSSSLGQLARDIQPTVPVPAAVRARINRRSRIRSVAAIGVAAAVAGAVILIVAVLRDNTESTPPADQNGIEIVGTPVWMVDDVLHIGDQQYPQDKEVQTALAPVQSGAVYGAGGGDIVYQPMRGAAQVIATDAAFGPAADPDSDLVAWLVWSKPDGRYDLTLYDVGRGGEIWAGPVEATLSGQDNPFGGDPLTPIEWIGANPEGGYTVLYTAHDGQPRRYDAKANGAGMSSEFGTPADDITPDVLAHADRDNRVTFASPTGGDISSVDGIRADGGGLTHDGDYFAGLTSGGDGAITVVDTSTGEARRIDAPDGTAPSQLSWTSDHTLMFLAPDDDQSTSGSVIACDADTLQCANVAQVDDISTVTLPTL